ncbi:MAG: ACT domain-containing protein [Planctomycetes bacterium]|nr:ACT domain-containing protein [Planctomycetota bacterium]
MELKPQITVFLENTPGTMAKVCEILADNNVNIDAFTIFGTVDHGVLRIIVNNPDKALEILSKSGFLAIQTNVIEVPVENTPGVLFKISKLLSGNGVNVEYGYGSTSLGAHEERFFLRASDNLRALEILEKELS